MGKDQIGGSPLKKDRAVNAVHRGQALAIRDERPHRRGGSQGVNSLLPLLRTECCNQIKHAVSLHALRRPIGAICPKAIRPVEDLKGALPVFPVGAYVAIKAVRFAPAGLAAGAVEIITILMQQNIGITDIDFVCSHITHLFQGSRRFRSSSQRRSSPAEAGQSA